VSVLAQPQVMHQICINLFTTSSRYDQP